jgi:hypothetical protein
MTFRISPITLAFVCAIVLLALYWIWHREYFTNFGIILPPPLAEDDTQLMGNLALDDPFGVRQRMTDPRPSYAPHTVDLLDYADIVA